MTPEETREGPQRVRKSCQLVCGHSVVTAGPLWGGRLAGPGKGMVSHQMCENRGRTPEAPGHTPRPLTAEIID